MKTDPEPASSSGVQRQFDAIMDGYLQLDQWLLANRQPRSKSGRALASRRDVKRRVRPVAERRAR